MDKDRVKGSAKQVAGNIKQSVGKALGDSKLQAEGRAQKAEGKVQSAIGGMKDTARSIVRKR